MKQEFDNIICIYNLKKKEGITNVESFHIISPKGFYNYNVYNCQVCSKDYDVVELIVEFLFDFY